MQITVNQLLQCNACDEGMVYFVKKYGEGPVDIVTLIQDKEMPKDFKYWGAENFILSKEEQDLYNKEMNVVDSNYVYQSSNITNSGNIVKSEKVDNSGFVYYSKNITDGRIIVGSSYIDGGESIYRSDFITNSQKIVHSKNVTQSYNVAYSNAIVEAQDVFKSTEITYCGQIRHSTKLENCYFCSNCHNSKNLLFCYTLDNCNDGQYYLFNKPVSKTQWNAVFKLYVKMIEHLTYVKEWPVEMNITPMVHATQNYSHHYRLTEDCMEWIKSLPNYDEWIMYSITALPNFLS